MNSDATLSIVVICTGNICRSPMAEALLMHDLHVRGVRADVASAGTLGLDSQADPNAVAVMAGRGIDIWPHRSRLLTKEILSGTDLVIGMAREHVRAAALLESSCYARAFTLRDLVRRAHRFGGPAGDEPVGIWAARLSSHRDVSELMGESPFDDIADPIGMSRADFERTAAVISDLSSALAVSIAAGRVVDVDRSDRDL